MKLLTVTMLFLLAITIHSFTAAQQAPGSLKSAANALQVAPDLADRLAKYRRVTMPFRMDGLSAREVSLVRKLVEASQHLENIYWRQSDPEALKLYLSLAGGTSQADAALRRFVMINGSRFDLIDHNKPFVGSESMPPGRTLYPKDATREEIEAYAKAHPERRAALYSPYTVVVRRGKDLDAVPYHVHYQPFVGQAAASLRQAADLSDDAAFAGFLRLRAAALLNDDYYASDIAWIDLKDPKFDVIFGPYETYLDELLGIKTAYGAAVMIRNDVESQKLAVFQKYVADWQDSLPLAPEDRPSVRGHATPMEVMDAPFRGGDLRHGYQAVAVNLPNDPRIHQEKGTKKIFFKNFMDARVNEIILPLAKIVMAPDQAALASAEGYLAGTLMHEIAHGLGPRFVRIRMESGIIRSDGTRTVTQRTVDRDIREAIGPIFSALEEAKADVVGMVGLRWLIDRGAMPKDRLPEYYASYLAGMFRTIRFGTAEAHGQAELMEFNYLSERGAITRVSGRYRFESSRMPEALDALAKELLEIEATGDRGRAERWFAKYRDMPPELSAALKQATSVPVDVDPVFSFPEPIR